MSPKISIGRHSPSTMISTVQPAICAGLAITVLTRSKHAFYNAQEGVVALARIAAHN